MQNFFSQILNFVFKLVMAVFGLIFAACFLLAASVLVVFGFVRWAVTGTKPAPFAAFSQFRQFRQRQRQGGSFSPFSRRPVDKTASKSEVVDVEVREVRVASPAKNDSGDANSQP